MRLAIVNRFVPPDPSMTGRMAADLAVALRHRFPDWPITLVTTARSYRNAAIPPIDDDSIQILRVGSRFAEQGRLTRLAGSLVDGRALARAAHAAADVVIALTDPPLLGYWMGRQAARTGGKWVEWGMDLFPDAFIAAGMARGQGLPVRYIMNSIRRHPPDFRLSLGPGQQAYLERTRGRSGGHAIWPAGITTDSGSGSGSGASPSPDEPLHIGYVGNVGEAHSREAIARLINHAPPDRFRFTLAVSGGGAEPLRARVGTAPHVTFTDYLDEDALSLPHVHLVSLREEWAHISVPSKAVTAIMSGRPFLYAGPTESDTWTMLGDAGWRVPADGGDDAALSRGIEAMADRGEWHEKQTHAERLRHELLAMRDTAIDGLCQCLSDWRDEMGKD